MADEAKRRRQAPEVVEAVFVLVVLVLVVGAGLAGWVVGKESESPPAAAETPPGHTGVALLAEEFGDPVRGKLLFEEKACVDCHSYGGEGGEDAPPLDYMAGHLSAREVAGMSGNIWNHLPAMLHHFEEEGIPVPTFAEGEMEDLIAYLHSGQ
jgi:hypothetical protein